jgi:hypothetical protein
MITKMRQITRLELFQTTPDLPSMLDLRRSSASSEPPTSS